MLAAILHGSSRFHPAIDPPECPDAEGWAFVFVQGRLVAPAGNALVLHRGPLHDLQSRADTRHYLGRLAGQDCWALRLPATPAGWREVSLRAALMALSQQAEAAPLSAPPAGEPAAPWPARDLFALAGRAAQLIEWDRAHRYCGVCGTPTEPVRGERVRRCPACGHSAWPRLSPAMMALVWRRTARGAELLLARAPHFVAGMYSALAGFVEAGESLEECLHREVAEEVGVQVHAPRYYGSQSWPFPHSLMVAFSAEWAGGEIVPQPGEIEDANWYPLDALPGIPPRFSIAGHLIRDLVNELA